MSRNVLQIGKDFIVLNELHLYLQNNNPIEYYHEAAALTSMYKELVEELHAIEDDATMKLDKVTLRDALSLRFSIENNIDYLSPFPNMEDF